MILYFFLIATTDVQNMSVVNAQSPKTTNNTSALQTTLQNLAAAKKRSTTSIDSNNRSNNNNDLVVVGGGRSNHHYNTAKVVGDNKDENWEGSLHSYHAWLKEKQRKEEKKPISTTLPSVNNNTNNKFTTPTTTSATTPSSSVKDEEEEEEDVINPDDNSYQVDAIMERGPSPPENNENSNSYEWSYEEQFKQVRNIYDIYVTNKSYVDQLEVRDNITEGVF